MRPDEVIARLEGADDSVRAAVRLYESQNARREAVLHATRPS
jgi:hypothetical protein